MYSAANWEYDVLDSHAPYRGADKKNQRNRLCDIEANKLANGQFATTGTT